jgi:hypothetical protein
MSHNFSYLALGDSYTIGEGVPLYESYPYQAIQLLRSCGIPFYPPEVVAKSGWTTSELASHIEHTILNTSYDVVSLLIGVNNQYKGCRRMFTLLNLNNCFPGVYRLLPKGRGVFLCFLCRTGATRLSQMASTERRFQAKLPLSTN